MLHQTNLIFFLSSRTKMRRKKFIPIPEADQPEGKIDSRSLTLDEIEEIKRKRERNKQKDKKKDKEDGELGSDEDEGTSSRRNRSQRERSPYLDR